MNHATTPEHLQLDLTWQEPIPPAGVQAAMGLMDSAKLHRYGETGAKPGEAAALEADFAAEIGMPYCVAMNSCGSTCGQFLWVLKHGLPHSHSSSSGSLFLLSSGKLLGAPCLCAPASS